MRDNDGIPIAGRDAADKFLAVLRLEIPALVARVRLMQTPRMATPLEIT